MKLFKRFGDRMKGRFYRGINRYGDRRAQHVVEPTNLKEIVAATAPQDTSDATKPSKRRRRSTKSE